MTEVLMTDPNWFYSAIAQCSAALLGLIGIFAALRLQREVAVRDQGDPNHIPLSFILLGIGSAILALFCLVFPLYSMPTDKMENKVIILGALLSALIFISGYFIVEIRHYDFPMFKQVFYGKHEKLFFILILLFGCLVLLLSYFYN